jgi:signal peptidase II
LKKFLKRYSVLIPTVAIVVTLDQLTKSIVRQNLDFGEMWMPYYWLSPYARIVHWYNTGVAFGMFQDKNLLFSILSLSISIFLIIFYPKLTEDDWYLKIALGLMIGGSLGNLIDRLTVGHVTDYISVGNFPVFNVADAAISIGVAVMILGLWVDDRNEKKKKKTPENIAESQKQVGD